MAGVEISGVKMAGKLTGVKMAGVKFELNCVPAGSGASGGVKKRSSTSTSPTDVRRLDGGFGHVGAGSVTDGDSCDSEFAQQPRRCGRQFKHVLFALLQEQFLQLPLALHRQQTGGILQYSPEQANVTYYFMNVYVRFIGPLVASSLRSERYSLGPSAFYYAEISLDKLPNYYLDCSYSHF